MLLTYNSYRVGIYSPCSGAESMVVFISAIIAYTLSERNIKFKKIAIYAVIGLISLFFINILRLILLVLIGYNFGADAMRFFHYNLGWIFFVVGMAVFWFLVMQNKEG
jgi:archaeosortase C (PEF-CTERM variant)